MFHMLTCFDLKQGVTIDEFVRSVETYAAHMKEKNLTISMGPIGERQ